MARRGERAPLSALQVVIATTLAVAAVILAAQAKQAAAASYPYEYDSKMQYTVHGVVKAAIKNNNGVGAALIRLLFHDCWVKGCDGSVLLGERTKEESARGTGVEKNAFSNIGLGGFDVVDKIKEKLPDVSCADIVVFAAREATILLSNYKITYDVKAGRRDGVFSSAEYADSVLPPPTFNFEQLKANFAQKGKGFNQTELVILSGAHAVGKAHYVSFEDRLKSPPSSPIDEQYQKELNRRRDGGLFSGLFDGLFGGQPKPTTENNNIRDMEPESRTRAGYQANEVDMAATGVLDNSYYNANLQNRVLFKSDWELITDVNAEQDMITYKKNAEVWYYAFGDAMAKLSNLAGVGTEIRKNCKKTNY